MSDPTPEQERGPRRVYANEAIEVQWEPKLCIHVRNCVRGQVRIVDPNGGLIREDTRVALCRCGASGNKPFCDGSHRRIGFQA